MIRAAWSRTDAGRASSGIPLAKRANSARTGSISLSRLGVPRISAPGGLKRQRLPTGERVPAGRPHLARLLVRDLEHVAVRILEVHGKVRAVIHGGADGHPAGDEAVVEGLEILRALDLPGNVEQPDLLRRLRGRVHANLPETKVMGIRVPGDGEEDHLSGKPAGHGEANHVPIERLRAVQIAHLQHHVAELLQRHGDPRTPWTGSGRSDRTSLSTAPFAAMIAEAAESHQPG